jgi:ATP-dependent Clp protease ATP-binding subunit ClpX
MYDLPSEENVSKCIITREVVLERVNPTLVPRAKERAERPARGERSA